MSLACEMTRGKKKETNVEYKKRSEKRGSVSRWANVNAALYFLQSLPLILFAITLRRVYSDGKMKITSGMTTLIAVAVRICFKKFASKTERFAAHPVYVSHTQFLTEESCVWWSKVLYSRTSISKRYNDRWQGSLHYTSKLLSTNWLFQLFLQRDVLRDEWHFLVAPKTTVINAESSHTFFTLFYSDANVFFFFGSRARFGKKKCCEVLNEQEKAEVDLYITKFEKLRQNLRHRFSLNIYY